MEGSCASRLPLRWQPATTLDIRKVRHIVYDVAVLVCVKHLEESATAQVCDSARRARVMRSMQNLRNARRVVVEDEVEAEEHVTQGACVRSLWEVHSGSLIVCDGT